jgi:DnaJ-class molecular chaperone
MSENLNPPETDVPCPHCEGEGKIIEVEEIDDEIIPEYFTCKTCDGSGYVDERHAKQIHKEDNL